MVEGWDFGTDDTIVVLMTKHLWPRVARGAYGSSP